MGKRIVKISAEILLDMCTQGSILDHPGFVYAMRLEEGLPKGTRLAEVKVSEMCLSTIELIVEHDSFDDNGEKILHFDPVFESYRLKEADYENHMD